MTDYYDRIVAQRYDQTRSWRPPLSECVAQLARLTPGSRVLDIGTGTGNLIVALRDVCDGRYVGLDVSAAMLERAKAKRGEARFVQADAADMPFRPGIFDAVVASFMVHHIPRERRQRMVDHCFRVLGRGRVVFITRSHAQIEAGVYAHFFPQVAAIDRRRFPTIDQLFSWLSRSGFVNIGQETFVDTPITVDRNFLERVRIKQISTLDLIDERAFTEGLARIRQTADGVTEDPVVFERRSAVIYGEKR